MYGSILGDMIGSPYEFDQENKTKDFPLFIPASRFTDDSVMTVAITDALMYNWQEDDQTIIRAVTAAMVKWGREYPHAGYGGRFAKWLFSPYRKPYNSYGNGSAMRVSSVSWFFDDLGEVMRAARLTAIVTHSHPEGIRGAQAAACAGFLARTGAANDEIREYITKTFGYRLDFTCDEIRPGYTFDVSCQGTVPQAITAFLEGKDFEDVVRTAASLGGDCDTLTCIAGGIAECCYPVPEWMKEECRKRLYPDMLRVLDAFEDAMKEKKEKAYAGRKN